METVVINAFLATSLSGLTQTFLIIVFAVGDGENRYRNILFSFALIFLSHKRTATNYLGGMFYINILHNHYAAVYNSNNFPLNITLKHLFCISYKPGSFSLLFIWERCRLLQHPISTPRRCQLSTESLAAISLSPLPSRSG